MTEPKKILQIIPVNTQVWATYEADEERFAVQVDLWALVEDENGEREVVGMDANERIDFVEAGNFSGYTKEPIENESSAGAGPRNWLRHSALSTQSPH